MTRRVRLGVAMSLMTALQGGCAKHHVAGVVRVESAEVRVLPSQVGAFYARIINDADDATHLRGVDSPAVADAQLHDVVVEDGMTTMRQARDGFEIPAHGQLVLARGASHVMLFGVRKGAENLPLTLHFDHGTTLRVEVPPRSALDD